MQVGIEVGQLTFVGVVRLEGGDERIGEGFVRRDVLMGKYDNLPGESVTECIETAALLPGFRAGAGGFFCILDIC